MLKNIFVNDKFEVNSGHIVFAAIVKYKSQLAGHVAQMEGRINVHRILSIDTLQRVPT